MTNCTHNKSGPSTDPCGTACLTREQEDTVLFYNSIQELYGGLVRAVGTKLTDEAKH